jgi:hypothetical protein
VTLGLALPGQQTAVDRCSLDASSLASLGRAALRRPPIDHVSMHSHACEAHTHTSLRYTGRDMFVTCSSHAAVTAMRFDDCSFPWPCTTGFRLVLKLC